MPDAARARQTVVCPHCSDLLGTTGLAACPGCGSRYHAGCWREVQTKGGCVVFGCPARGDARADVGGAVEAPLAQPRNLALPIAVGLLVAAGLAVAGVSWGVQKLQTSPSTAPPDAVERMPGTRREWLDLAYKRFNSYDHKGAIAAATQAVGSPARPWAEALSIRGLAYAWEKDFTRGFADLDRAIALEPTNARHFRNRAVAHELEGDHAGCIRDCETVLRLDPQSSEAGFLRAKIAEHEAALARERK